MGMGFGFNDFGFSGFSTGFNIMGIFVTLIFVVVIGMFIVIAVKGISQWNKNNHSPRLTVPATVVAKRTNVSRHHHHNNMHHTTHSTTYYVTFQVQSGDRMELHVTGQEYGLLEEGDQGSLSFQGTRYLGFERD
jgi:heme/copper-type cytochrome/quinol oxidase subunit 2